MEAFLHIIKSNPTNAHSRQPFHQLLDSRIILRRRPLSLSLIIAVIRTTYVWFRLLPMALPLPWGLERMVSYTWPIIARSFNPGPGYPVPCMRGARVRVHMVRMRVRVHTNLRLTQLRCMQLTPW